MSRKMNLEDTVVHYFTTAPLPAAELMLRIVTGAVKRRQAPATPATPGLSAARVSAVRKARRQAEDEAAEPSKLAQ